MSPLRAMSPLNIERLESVCVTFIQHQKYRTLSASVIVTINSSFFSVYGTHCTLSSDSSILFIVIRFVNLRILSSLSGHFEIFSDVLSTPVVSIIHTSLMIRKQNNSFHQSEQTVHLLLTSPLICFLETVWSRIPHTYSSSYENCLCDHFWMWIIWESIMMNPIPSCLIKTYADDLIVVFLWILNLHMTSPKIVIRKKKNKRWIIRQSTPYQ